MIEEITAVFFPFLSLFTSDPPRLSIENDIEEVSLISDNEKDEELWSDKIHREYQHHHQQRQTYDIVYADVTSINIQRKNQPTSWQSFRRSLQANGMILLSIFPLTITAIAYLYSELNTTQLCFEWKRGNHSLPFAVMRWRLIGEDIEILLLDLWFPLTMVLLFGWKEFKSSYISTLYLGFTVGTTVVISNNFLLIFGIFQTKVYYRGPGNVLFFAGVLFGSILVARKFRTLHSSVVQSSRQIFIQISFGFIVAFFLSVSYRYAIVPYFNKQRNEVYKAMVAAFCPALSVIPAAICRYLVLRKKSENFQPERSFVLVYFIDGGMIAVYRIMQADFNNIWWFITLSLLHGVSKVTKNATKRLRGKLWSRILKFLQKTICCAGLQEIPQNTPHRRRFGADMEIQGILFQYTTLVLSQAYRVLYKITNFDISVWPVLRQALIRLTLGLTIDFVFNCLSMFVQIHWYDIPVRRVWLKYWKRHLFANVIILIAIVGFFTPAFLSVFQTEMDNSQKQLDKKNCTLPPVTF